MEKQTRRKFLSTSAKIVAGVAMLPLINACAKTSIIAGKTMTYDIPEDGVAVIYKEDNIVMSRIGNTIYANTNVCNHLGCTLNYNAKDSRLDCPCHGSQYELSGKKIKGPASRSLDRYVPVITEDKKIKIDFSIVYKEGEEGYDSAIAQLE
jgi:Rieske Fe-S protein